jgi:hypothetical protein
MIDLANTRAPVEWNGCRKAHANPQQYGSMVDAIKEYTWLGVDDMQALLRKVEQGFETNKGGFRLLVLEKH